MATHDRLLRPAVLAAGSLLVLSTLLIACLACSVNAADGDSVVRPLALVLLYDAIVGLLAYAVCEHALTD